MDPADFLRLRFEALYVADPNGRILCSNEWDVRPAPRVHLMRVPGAAALRCRFDVPVDLVARLQAIVATEPPDGALTGGPACATALREALADQAPIEQVWSGPAFRFDGETRNDRPVGPVTPQDAAFLAGRFDDWRPDVAHRQPFVAALEDGRPAAICASVRISGAFHCAGVATHPDFRRRGYAAAAVAAWARAVRRLGAEPLYSTSWDNAASRGVARRLGLKLAATDFHMR